MIILNRQAGQPSHVHQGQRDVVQHLTAVPLVLPDVQLPVIISNQRVRQGWRLAGVGGVERVWRH